MKQFNVPILFLIFNRSETEKRVFEVIRKVKPEELYVAADGPRKNKKGEVEKCVEARKIIDEGIDWRCRVHKLYRSKNLGCKVAVSSAIDWFFKNVEEGVILEDDCLPDLTFFRFCAELLEKYRNDKRILTISGDNFQNGGKRGNGSYYFSKFTHIWGWAFWRDRWQKYDVGMRDWPIVKKNKNIKYDSLWERKYWEAILDKVFAGEIDTWDYQLLYNSMKFNYLNVIPNYNLVENIGVGSKATHTKGEINLPKREKLTFPIKHPKVHRSKDADIYTERTLYKINILSNLCIF